MKLIYLPSFIILLLLPHIVQVDPIDNVANLIKQGNARELAKLFASNIEIAIMDDENIYSQTQATLILDKFFSKNKPKSIKLLHKVNSSANYRFGVFILTTDTGLYRVAFTLKGTDSKMTIIELRIENEKVK
jgi:Na+-transporting NADH:ubiquinone oxidoreductase subunit NqrC